MLFSPDLDIDSAVDHRWGVFRWIWEPYMKVVLHHSRLLSHSLIIPPLVRILYFFVVTFHFALCGGNIKSVLCTCSDPVTNALSAERTYAVP